MSCLKLTMHEPNHKWRYHVEYDDAIHILETPYDSYGSDSQILILFRPQAKMFKTVITLKRRIWVHFHIAVKM